MKLALIIDNGQLQKWQHEALNHLENHTIELVLNCRNTRTKKRPLRHGFYYVLNLLSIRNHETGRVHVTSQARVIDFEAEYLGGWQKLPDSVLAALRATGVDAVVKFGMSLLVVPEQDELAIPILSYHHGDPDKYRGRPAGFYELLNDEDVMGVIVQVLSNRLDAGKVIAYGESPLVRHSYKQTLVEAYKISPFLLRTALRNIEHGHTIAKQRLGRNYRLPSNWLVLRFVWQRLRLGLRHFLYGALKEKRWRVSILADHEPESLFPSNRQNEVVVSVMKGYSFYADPFFVDSDRVIVEALNSRNGKGELLLIDGGSHNALLTGEGHFSYPCVVTDGTRRYVIPEVATWTQPRLYMFEQSALKFVQDIEMEGAARLIDPTVWCSTDGFYIFANQLRHGQHVLSLWHADRLEGPYSLHPASPIRISPSGGRMAGGIFEKDGQIFRLGQNNVRGYGNGIIAFRVVRITPWLYEEDRADTLLFSDRKGPHTLNRYRNHFCYDWYTEGFSLAAGYRRVLARMAAK